MGFWALIPAQTERALWFWSILQATHPGLNILERSCHLMNVEWQASKYNLTGVFEKKNRNRGQVAKKIKWPVCLCPPLRHFPPITLIGRLIFFLSMEKKKKRAYKKHFVSISKLPEESAVGKITISLFLPKATKSHGGDLWKRVKNCILGITCFFKLLKSNPDDLECARVGEEPCPHLHSSPPRTDPHPSTCVPPDFNEDLLASRPEGLSFPVVFSPLNSFFEGGRGGQEKCHRSPAGHFHWVFYPRSALALGILCPDLVWLLFYFLF